MKDGHIYPYSIAVENSVRLATGKYIYFSLKHFIPALLSSPTSLCSLGLGFITTERKLKVFCHLLPSDFYLRLKKKTCYFLKIYHFFFSKYILSNDSNAGNLIRNEWKQMNSGTLGRMTVVLAREVILLSWLQKPSEVQISSYTALAPGLFQNCA